MAIGIYTVIETYKTIMGDYKVDINKTCKKCPRTGVCPSLCDRLTEALKYHGQQISYDKCPVCEKRKVQEEYDLEQENIFWGAVQDQEKDIFLCNRNKNPEKCLGCKDEDKELCENIETNGVYREYIKTYIIKEK